jgi:CheY-like chemotaxis protein
MAHILLVDDDPIAVASNTEAIEDLGHSVSSTSTTADAIKFVRRDTPDLVVMEAVLGGKFGGLDLARAIAADYPELPLIMLTQGDQRLTNNDLANEDREGWIPVSRYLEKPVLTDVLVDEIDHLLPEAE